MDQVAKNDNLLGQQLMGQVQEAVEGGCITIAGQGNAVDLEGFRLTQMEIGDEQDLALGIPHRLGSQQLEGVVLPVEGGTFGGTTVAMLTLGVNPGWMGNIGSPVTLRRRAPERYAGACMHCRPVRTCNLHPRGGFY